MRFALTGVAGFVAKRHLKAIKETGNSLEVALDPHDNVGILDQFFPQAHFFTEFERFDRHIEKLKDDKIDYVSICSPNYLHDAHIRFALRAQADAICEKPLVLNPWNLDALSEFEQKWQKNIFSILQLRLHPEILKLKNKPQQKNKRASIELSYITSRGKWYEASWKNQEEKSGGLTTNIGIHFFDMLCWIFGPASKSHVHFRDGKKSSGFLELEKADITWYLSIDANDLPESEGRTYRSLKIDGEEVDFTAGFEDLHTQSYRNILNGEGFGVEDTRQSIELAYQIRNDSIKKAGSFQHPLLEKLSL